MKLKAEWIRLTPEKRLHQLGVPLVGLTGGIATGKSTVAGMLSALGIPVINADHLVKAIYQREETRGWIQFNYPKVMNGADIDFRKLREKFFSAPAVKDEIEAYIYARLPGAFGAAYEALGRPEVVVYDVPLLFEKQLDSLVDLRVVVYAPEKIQRARLMARDGHEEAMASTIMGSQLDIEEKKERADIVIDNSASLAELTEEVNQFVRRAFL